MDKFLNSSNPGANLVDSIPILDRLPDILAPWRKDAVRQRAFNRKTYIDLVDGVREKLRSGVPEVRGTFAAYLCEKQADLGLDDLDVAYLAGSMWALSNRARKFNLRFLNNRFEAGECI